MSFKSNSIKIMLGFILINVNLAKASDVNMSLMPEVAMSPAQQEITWRKYCVGDRVSTETPVPNYADDEVKSVARKLVQISPMSYYFYSGPLYSYGLKNNKELVEPPQNFPSDLKEVRDGRKNAHAFLTLLCGEFRDRPSLIQAKMKWVQRLRYLPPVEIKKPLALNEEVWQNMTAYDYVKYIAASKKIFQEKKQNLDIKNYQVDFKKYQEDYPIDPFTVCETKFIFNKYVRGNESFTNFATYDKQYKAFKKKCSDHDLEYIYNFRGDSNFKPNSPESNGMIWYSSTITSNCRKLDGQFVLKDNAKDKIQDPTICEKYMKNPFAYRWSAARAGLATWLLRDPTLDTYFSDTHQPVIIVPHLDPFNKPFDFKLPNNYNFSSTENLVYPSKNEEGQYYIYNENGEIQILTDEEGELAISKYTDYMQKVEVQKESAKNSIYSITSTWGAKQSLDWRKPDFGFNQFVGIADKPTRGFANRKLKSPEQTTALKALHFERLRDAVNRHTDWYGSGYDDGLGIKRDQAYSPFVASSYEMSASDAFTAPGITVKSEADGCKHWMFVFKLKKDQWYTTQSVNSRQPVNFNYHWFDETSLGTNPLADSEHAFDRLGTALEGEMDSILYLHNITTDGEVNSECGREMQVLQ